MGLTLRQIRNNTADVRDLMRKSRLEKFAVGAFSLDNQEMLKAVCRAALVKKSPVIVEVGPRSVEALGFENIRDMVDNYKNEFGLEIYISLYHANSISSAVTAIETGFELINIDLSKIIKNQTDEASMVKHTKALVDYGKLTGVLIEGELPYSVPDSEKQTDYARLKKFFTVPESAQKFIDLAGIDIFTVSVGNIHGNYSAPKVLDLQLLQKIRDSLGINLSIHGGAGTPDHYFEDAVKIGVSKLSVDSELRFIFRTALETELKQHPQELDISKLMDDVISSVQRLVEEKIDLFRSAGKIK